MVVLLICALPYLLDLIITHRLCSLWILGIYSQLYLSQPDVMLKDKGHQKGQNNYFPTFRHKKLSSTALKLLVTYC